MLKTPDVRTYDSALKLSNARTVKSDWDSMVVDPQVKELSTESGDDKSSGSR